MANVELRNLRKRFGPVEVIRDVSLEIADGEFVVFVGPSGCGKSTLLRMIAGLEDITEGDLLIDGTRRNDDPPKQRGVAMVFQSYALYPHKTVRANMAFNLRISGLARDEIARKVEDAAAILEITHLLDRRPGQLSGGQRQRVAIGRAIVRNPRIFLFDEPLSNLDAALRVNMRMEIARLHNRLGVTMAYVTHDQVEAMTLADRIVVLDDGRIRQVGTPMELYERPVDRFVAAFIGSPQMNFIDVRVVRSGPEATTIRVPTGAEIGIPVPSDAAPGTEAALGIRPEDAFLAPDDPHATGEVEVVERLGAQTQLGLRLDQGATLIMIVPSATAVRPGDTVGIRFHPDKAHLFDADGRACRAGAIAP